MCLLACSKWEIKNYEIKLKMKLKVITLLKKKNVEHSLTHSNYVAISCLLLADVIASSHNRIANVLSFSNNSKLNLCD